MSDSADLPDATELDPEEAFGVFSHEIRVETVLALWEASDHAMPFGDLRAAVGVDDKGKFNYHLSKLSGQFVDRTDGEYELTYAGHRLVDAIQSGVFHRTGPTERTEIDSECRECGGGQVFEYADHIVTVRCRDCSETALEYPFDPGGLGGRSGREVVRAFSRQVMHGWSRASSGICPTCSGPVGAAVVDRGADPGATDHMYYREAIFDDHPVFGTLECQRCSFYNYVPVGAVLLTHPGIAGPLFEAGVDVREQYLWELPFLVDSDRITVLARDPWRVAVSVSIGDSERRAVLGEDLDVRRIERHLS